VVLKSKRDRLHSVLLWPFAKVSKWLLRALLWIYVSIALIDPLDQIFHAKSALFLMVVALWLIRLVLGYAEGGRRVVWAGVIGVGLIIPLEATLVGLLSGRNPVVGMRFNALEIFLILFLILVIECEKVDLAVILIRACALVALIEIGITIIAITSPLLYALIYEFTAIKQTAYLSRESDRFGFGIGSFYYKTSATMILPLGYYVARLFRGSTLGFTDFMLSLLYFVALVFSGARANLVAAIGVVAVFALGKIRRAFGTVSSAVALVLMIAIAAGLYVPTLIDPAERSNAVKLGHVASYVSEFDRHPAYLIWGEGADTEFYSAGFQQRTTITEVTYLELIRNFGIPVSMILLAALLWPLSMLLRADARAAGLSYLAVPYVAFVFMAGSNPLLLSTTGMLLVVSIWGVALSIQTRTIEYPDPQEDPLCLSA
jgi:hypothetical protein